MPFTRPASTRNPADHRYGRALQWVHRRRDEDSPLPKRRRLGIDAAALRGAIQPSTAAVSLEEQNPHANHEAVVSIPSSSLP